MRSLKNCFNSAEKWICIVLFFVTLVLLTIQVVSRYVFNSSPSWTEELARYCFVWLIFLGASYAASQAAHITIDTAINIYPKKIRKYMALLGLLIWTVVNIFIVYYSAKFTLKLYTSNRISISLFINVAYVYAAIPVGYAFTTIRILQKELLPILFSFKGNNKIGENGDIL